MSDDLQDLVDGLLITEERQRAIDLTNRRMTVDHSLSLNRSPASLGDVLRMLTYLRAQGAPDTADISMSSKYSSLARISVRWSTDPDAEAPRAAAPTPRRSRPVPSDSDPEETS